MFSLRHRIRAAIIFAVLLGGFAFLFLRLVQIQCAGHSRFRKLARGQHLLNIRVEPRRGEIYDRKGGILAMSIPTQSLYAVPHEVEAPGRLADTLAPLLHMDSGRIEARLKRKKGFIWIRRKLDEVTVSRVRTLNAPGLYLCEEMKRFYPKKPLLGHVLGFVGMDNEGLEGLELFADPFLRGRPGWRATEKDRKGREILPLRAREVPPEDGCSLVLTVDEVVQHIVENELDKAWREHRAKAAVAIVMVPRTGDVLAMAVRPGFDPARPAASPEEWRRNRAVTDFYEPGSTFKIVTGTAALDRGITSLDEEFFCENGAFRVAGHVLHDVHAHGTLTFLQIIQKSSNIGAAKVGMRLGKEQLFRYVRAFGFGSRTGIDLVGESPGMVHPPRRWSRLSIAMIPMGHEVAVTPIQMLTAVSAIANEGILMKPRLVRRIINPDGRPVRRFPPVARRRVVGWKTARQMRGVMQTVVGEEGTARRARVKGYEVAGKTGTAQKPDPRGGYSHTAFISSFVGFLPADDPEVAILVLLDEPRPLYYGGVVAAPAFRAMAEKIMKYLDVPSKGERGRTV